jgi:TatD DNase family protein
MWIDHHCHLPAAPEHLGWLRDARAAGVDAVVDVGTDVAGSRGAIERAAGVHGVWATAGVHPHDAAGGIEGLEELLAAPEVVAVGECGLDYHYLHSPAEAQREAFAAQVELAHRHDLALVIHSREAWDDTFAVLREAGTPERTVFHCFTGGPIEARRCLDAGAHLSFSGIVTFPSAGELRDAAQLCPIDRLLVETDSPYLAPVPHRGRPNRPEHVAVVGRFVADLRGLPAEELAAAATATTRALYRLPDEVLG